MKPLKAAAPAPSSKLPLSSASLVLVRFGLCADPRSSSLSYSPRSFEKPSLPQPSRTVHPCKATPYSSYSFSSSLFLFHFEGGGRPKPRAKGFARCHKCKKCGYVPLIFPPCGIFFVERSCKAFRTSQTCVVIR